MPSRERSARPGLPPRPRLPPARCRSPAPGRPARSRSPPGRGRAGRSPGGAGRNACDRALRERCGSYLRPCTGFRTRRPEGDVMNAPVGLATTPRRWAVLAVVSAAQFLIILDLWVVNIALPVLRHDFAPATL